MDSKQEKKNGMLHAALGWLAFIAVFLILVILILHVLGQQIQVSGYSMYPTLQEGDSLILDRISYRIGRPERGDIIVFPSRYQEGVRYIKRVIALPGETVQIINGKIYVNGQVQEEPDQELIDQPGLAARQIQLAEDEYFVLGDNRSDSSDSREPGVGHVKRSEIEGKVWLRIWPLKRIGIL